VYLQYLIHDIGYLISDLYSIDGRKIRELVNQELPAGNHEIEIDVSDLPAGMYYFRIRAGDKVGGGKMVRME